MERPTTPPTASPTNTAECLQKLAGEAFAEIQRADIKAATLCATALAGLAALTAASATRSTVSTTTAVVLWTACVLQVLSVAAAIFALRPSLRAADRLHPLSFLDLAESTPGEVLVTVRRFSAEELMRADCRRAVELSVLARRKFVALRHAATLLILSLAAAAVAGALAVAGVTVS